MTRKTRPDLAIRSNRRDRNIEDVDILWLLSAPMTNVMRGTSHVSHTIVTTRNPSNRNHPSRKALRLRTKAMKRANSSKVKQPQNRCAAIWKMGSASDSDSASLQSVSMAIQTVFNRITQSVVFLKMVSLANACQKPVL